MISNSIIKRLADNVINQIKAGEVIERPLNVVKELVENSLDASATAIRIELLDGGKLLIQISDNGTGIAREEVPLAIERHTTSKLNSFEDLQGIKSFGFRGEALASISAVSNFSIKTKTQKDELGCEILFENGYPVHKTDVVMTTGTSITVKNIFHKLPARLKFLRTTATEFSLIHEFMYAMSMAYPQVSFQFLHNGRTVFDYKSQKTLSERFREVMGIEAKDYTDVNFTRGNFHLTGFTILPDKIKSPQNSFVLFVNGRFIKDRFIRASIHNAYQGLLMKGVAPSAVLFIHIEPKLVDVNAHPSKIEVRFYDPIMVQDYISRGISDAVKSKLNESFKQTSAVCYVKNEATKNNFHLKTHVHELPFQPVHKLERHQSHQAHQLHQAHELQYQTHQTDQVQQLQLQSLQYEQQSDRQQQQQNILFEPICNPGFFTNSKFLGQFAQCYLIFQNETELWFVDQHAFHERILFEELQSSYAKTKLTKQILLNPTIIPSNQFSAHIYKENSEIIDHLGFEIEMLKDNSIAIHSVPVFLNLKYISDTFSEISQKLCKQEAVDINLIYHDCFATIACHSAIRSGESLNQELVQKLMNRANDVDFFAHCPHGRPVIRKFSQNDLARWFERI